MYCRASWLSSYYISKRGVSVEVDILFKIAAIGIVISILSKVLDEAGRKEQAQMTTLVGVVIVLMMVIQLVSQLFSNVKSMFQLY